jgi:hypothetical protein
LAHRSPEGETKLRQKLDVPAASEEKTIRDIRRATRLDRAADEKIRSVLSGLRGEAHLRRAKKSYAEYYNRARTHLSLNKDSPSHRLVQRRGNIIAHSHLAGFHHEYARTE